MRTIWTQFLSKNKQGHILVQTKGNEVSVKNGFVPVKNHPMGVTSMNIESVLRYYDVPDNISI